MAVFLPFLVCPDCSAPYLCFTKRRHSFSEVESDTTKNYHEQNTEVMQTITL